MKPESGRFSPSGDAHPGKILFDDKIIGTSTKKEAWSVPQSMAWVKNENGEWAAVTRIEITGTQERHEMTKFGADGSFLETAVQG